MRRLTLTTRYSRAMLHVSIAVIVVMLGHDVMMAMDPGDHGSGVSHHSIAVEQCGPEDGLVHGQNSLSFNPMDVAIPASQTLGWATSSDAPDPFAQSFLDASRLRALLQVYLN